MQLLEPTIVKPQPVACTPEEGGEGDSVNGLFCPVGGKLGSTSVEFNEHNRCLIHQRLRMASLVLLAGTAAFLIRNAWIGLRGGLAEVGGSEFLLPHAAVALVLGGVCVRLVSSCAMSSRELRILEIITFGLPAVFFVWMEYARACAVGHSDPETARQMAHSFAPSTVLPWMVLMSIYGVFIPNSWKRAATVVGLISLIPLAAAVAVSLRSPLVAEELAAGGFSSMVLWIAISAVTAVYGSHRFGYLRRQVYEAGRLGVYRLREKLGAGGMGEVYLAEHHLLKRPCAIKLIRPEKAGDAATVARFESEVQAAARLTHPNTIEIYDFGRTADGTFYYAMEFLPGLNLQDIVERFGPLPPERVVHLLRQVCSALRESHAAKLIHRDIKPGNIFAAERGGLYDVAKLLDFGLVKSLRTDSETAKLTMDGAMVGSPLYAPPELIVDGQPDQRSDIYSLGATAFFLLTGRPVFSGDNPLKIIFAHAHETPVAPSSLDVDVPADLEAVVMKCLEKQPEHRYGSVDELDEALAGCHLSAEWTQERAAQWWQSTGEDGSDSHTAASRSVDATVLMDRAQ